MTIDADRGVNTKINNIIVQPLSSMANLAVRSTHSFTEGTATVLKAYPNSFTDRLSLEVKEWHGKVTISVQDILGNTLLQTNGQVENQNLDLDSNGIHLQKVFT